MSLEPTSEYSDPLNQIRQAYRETYPGDELTIEGWDGKGYDFVLENNRTDNVRFRRNENFSDQSIDELVDQGELDIPGLTQIYREEAQNPATRLVEFSPEAKGVSEEQEDFWYAFTDIGETVMDPEACIRPNRFDCMYVFEIND